MLPYSKSKLFMYVSFGNLPGFRAKTKGRRSVETDPAKINPLLSMLTTRSAKKSCVILVSSLQVFLKGSGVSIRLVMSLNLIPGIGKSSTSLICFLNLAYHS